MLKLLYIPFLAGLISCGGDQDKNLIVNEVKRFEPIVVEEGQNLQNLRDICQALNAKERVLSILAQAGHDYTFTVSQKACQEEELSQETKIITTIQKLNENFVFRSKNNERIPFQNVETSKHGVMQNICGNIGRLTNPIQTQEGAIWFTTNTSKDHCSSDSQGICIHIQSGAPQDNVNYEIHTNEWIKFSLSRDRKGFFLQRKLISTVGCKKNQSFIQKAALN